MSASTVWTGTPLGGAPLLAVAIGASAGGPKAIEQVLSSLPWNFPAPILVCQHMTDGATAPWAQRLESVCKLRVCEATQAEKLLPRRVYIAPIGRHMRVRGNAAEPIVSLEPDRDGGQFVPSIDEMMLSVARVFGSRSMGVVLTGMGSDGARGLLAIREAGGVTMAQSVASSFMDGMPSAAAALGAVGEVVPLELIPGLIAKRVAGTL
jgi:two-component system chemotaxis response regulator CheB